MKEAAASERPWRRRARRLTALWPTAVMGAVLWVFLWGDVSWANVLGGAALGAFVGLAFPLPGTPDTGATFRPGAVLRLLGRFVTDLVLASFQVAWSALVPGRRARGGLVTVRLRTGSELVLAATAALTSLVPGTLVIDLDRSARTVRVHVLDLAGAGGPAAVRDSTLALEARLLRAFAPRAELERVGLGSSAALPAPGTGSDGRDSRTGSDGEGAP